MPSPRLSPSEEAAWRGFHEMRHLLLPRISRELAADSGLTEADYTILLALVDSPDRSLRSGELLRRLQWEPSRLSHQISRMHTRGTITRERCVDDARSFLIGLTDTGLSAIRRATPGHLRAVRRWFVDALSPDQLAALADVSATIAAHIDALESADADADSPSGQ